MADPVSTLAAVASAIAGCFAAYAASKAAAAAALSAKQSSDAEVREVARQVLAVAWSSVYEAATVAAIAAQVRSEAQTLAVFAGASGGSGHSEIVAGVEDKLKAADSLRQRAEAVGTDFAKLRRASIEDLSQRLTQGHRELAEVRALREEVAARLESLASQVRMYQQRVIGQR